jgi:N-glycosylase/DNA lyase
VPEHDLEEMQRCEDDLPDDYIFKNNLKACGVGYRAKYIINTSRIVESEMDMGKLAKIKYDKAFNTVLELPGVGPRWQIASSSTALVWERPSLWMCGLKE